MDTRETRSNCGVCGDTRGRRYTREIVGRGYISYCHNCGDREFVRNNQWTPSQNINRIKIINESNKDSQTGFIKKIKLPYDFSVKLPDKPLIWLHKYKITDEEIRLFRFGWSESYQRLILPVFNNEQLLYWQGRTFRPITKQNPKYLNIRQSGAKNVFFRRTASVPTHIDVFNTTNDRSGKIVIVEDILSAIKVGRYFDSLALLGSYLPNSIYSEIAKYDEMYLWLDDDKFLSSLKFRQELASRTTKKVKVIRTKNDPKECEDTLIKEIVC